MKTKGTENKRVNIVTLGCSKNQYDSECLAGQLLAQGKEAVHGQDGGIVLINTCGFIGDAKQESIDTILDYVEKKKSGAVGRIYVTGCLAQRYKAELAEELPEVDGFFSLEETRALLKELGVDYKTELVGERLLSTPKHYAYLKISEGCDRKCSFCAIPLIRGSHVSVPMERLVEEARILAGRGVKELILIAQDLTYYGLDLYKKQALADLLKELVKIDGIQWIRLHYTYPASFPEEVIDLIAAEPKICKYVDIPLQHISEKILRSMTRGAGKKKTNTLLARFREKIPGVAVRTTLIVGYPGETREDFEELLEWVKEQRFDRLGCFAYSEEEGTPAASLQDDVSEEEKQARVAEIMAAQQEISFELNQEKVGKTFRVLIDGEDEDFYIGRTQSDSPEVDNDVFIDKRAYRVPVGDFVKVNVTSAGLYDLFGIPVA